MNIILLTNEFPGIHCVVSVIQKYIFDSYGTLYFGSDKFSVNVKRNISTICFQGTEAGRKEFVDLI